MSFTPGGPSFSFFGWFGPGVAFLECTLSTHGSACLLGITPGFEQLRVSPLLSRVKREWNHSEAKYATFWDASIFLKNLVNEPLDWASVGAVRARLIICWRLLGLHRSVDLARLQRCVSLVGSTPFVLVRQKGWRTPKWEQVLSLPSLPSVSPWHLLQAYVALTATHAAPGDLVLRSLRPPFAAVTADTVGSVTRHVLLKGGVNTRAWAPHSTRGAGVRMFKDLGMSAEEVCEIGQWKNVATFSAHYLRLDAQQVAARRVVSLVHNVSPRGSAEPDRSRTPTNFGELGGSDREGEAQSLGETC